MGSTWEAIDTFLSLIETNFSPSDQQVPQMSAYDDFKFTEHDAGPLMYGVRCSNSSSYPSVTQVNFSEVSSDVKASAVCVAVNDSVNGISTLLNLDLDTRTSSNSPDQETSLYHSDVYSVGKCYGFNQNIHHLTSGCVEQFEHNVNDSNFSVDVNANNVSYVNLVQCSEVNSLELNQEMFGTDCKQDMFERDSLSIKLEHGTGNMAEPIIAVEKQLETCIQTLLKSNIDLEAISFEDVQETSRHLDIPENPSLWTQNNVYDWVSLQCRQFGKPLPPNMATFFITGEQLCSLSEQQFKEYAPGAGETLFALLFIWKKVVNQICPSPRVSGSYLPPLSHIPVPTSPSLQSHVQMVPGAHDDWDQTMDHDHTDQTTNTCGVPHDDTLPEEPVDHHRQNIKLWQFLRLLLVDPSGNFNDCIRWIDRSKGIFKIENSTRVARLWGIRKNRPAMNYDKLSRSIRQYYKKGIIKKTQQSKRLVYQFCNQ